jgi:hypothetical protein
MLPLVHDPSEMMSKFIFPSFVTFISLFSLPSPLLLFISFYLSAPLSFFSSILSRLYVKDSSLLLLSWSDKKLLVLASTENLVSAHDHIIVLFKIMA